jgi:hypothetical protein
VVRPLLIWSALGVAALACVRVPDYDVTRPCSTAQTCPGGEVCGKDGFCRAAVLDARPGADTGPDSVQPLADGGTPDQAPAHTVLTFDFDDNQAPGWLIEGTNRVMGMLMRVGDFPDESGAIYGDKMFSGSFILSADLVTVGRASGNRARVFFNYQNAIQTYMVEFAIIGPLTLSRIENGVVTVLGTYPAPEGWKWRTLEVRYDRGAITVTARNPDVAVLIDGVNDTRITSGRIGFGSLRNQLLIDNVRIESW